MGGWVKQWVVEPPGAGSSGRPRIVKNGAGVFLGTYDAVRITNKEYLDNVWHRFGFFAPLNILADASCARTCPTFSPGRPTNAAFLSAAHSPSCSPVSCSSCGSLKRHNAVAYGPLADYFKSQDIDFIKEHTVLESFGKKAVDGLLRNPYLSSAQTALDVRATTRLPAGRMRVALQIMREFSRQITAAT
eukprot:scaffold28837_cov116-Isochrysis_galbana.AAC.3